MDFIKLKRKPRPYAASSTGQSRGTLNLGSRIGRVQVYEAIEEARKVFTDKLSQAIITHLHDNSDNLLYSASFVDLSLFMMGKSRDRTKPVVMFVSDDKQARVQAFRMIKQSGIMEEYPGFGLAEMDLKAELRTFDLSVPSLLRRVSEQPVRCQRPRLQCLTKCSRCSRRTTMQGRWAGGDWRPGFGMGRPQRPAWPPREAWSATRAPLCFTPSTTSSCRRQHRQVRKSDSGVGPSILRKVKTSAKSWV